MYDFQVSKLNLLIDRYNFFTNTELVQVTYQNISPTKYLYNIERKYENFVYRINDDDVMDAKLDLLV